MADSGQHLPQVPQLVVSPSSPSRKSKKSRKVRNSEDSSTKTPRAHWSEEDIRHLLDVLLVSLSRADLACVVAAYAQRTQHDDLLFIAQLLTGFSALLRLGELTVPDNLSLCNSRKLCLRYTVTVSPGTVSFSLPSHKADQFFEGNKIVLTARADTTDPCRVIVAYLRSRDALHPFHPQL